MAIAGQKGVSVNIDKISNDNLSIEKILYSESQSRFIVTIDSKNKELFEKEMNEFIIGEVGVVEENKFEIKKGDEIVIDTSVKHLDEIYRERFKGY